MSPLFYGQGNSLKLSWLFYGKEMDGMEGLSPMHFFGDLEGEESNGVWK